MSARYLLQPGPVWSASDRQEHHVGASQLAALYGVPMSECLVLPPLTGWDSAQTRDVLLRRVDHGELIALTPRCDNDYSIPKIGGAK